MTLDSGLADERELGYGSGLSFVAPLAAQTALDRLFGTFEPMTIRLCARFRVRQLRRPIGFCNTYFDSFAALSGVAEAGSLVESFDLAPLAIRGSSVSMAAERGVVDDVIVGANGPGRVRAGRAMRVRVALRRRGGSPRTVGVRVPVPRDMRPGRRSVLIEGNGSQGGEEEVIVEIVDGLSRGSRAARTGPDAQAARAEPESVHQLARQVAALAGALGITARFKGRKPRVVLRSDRVRFDGRTKVSVRVLRRASRRARR